jgi:hypothetical protein
VAPSEGRDALRDAIYWPWLSCRRSSGRRFLLKHVEGSELRGHGDGDRVRPATLRMRVFRARDELRKLLAETVRD